MQNNYESIRQYQKYNCKKGDAFGRLTLTGVSYLKFMYGQRRRIVEAVCECGVVKDYLFNLLTKGETQSCGCLRKELTRDRMTTHNLSSHPLYEVYNKIIERCYNTENEAFENYGGRNIEVWAGWEENFVAFYDWCMANGYKEGLSIDRKDNNGNYSPQNCWFATRAEQNRNTRRNRMFTAFGETKCLFDWGVDKRCVLGVWGLRNRMDSGKWDDDFEGALTTKEDRKKAARDKPNNVFLTAFGETKCMTAWAEDERCVVGFDRLRDRIAEGWQHLEAITTVNKDKKEIDLTAFGETKSFTNWLKDERCVVKRDALRDRFRKGWKHQDCLTIPSKTGSKK